jgi:hypothetical protein
MRVSRIVVSGMVALSLIGCARHQSERVSHRFSSKPLLSLLGLKGPQVERVIIDLDSSLYVVADPQVVRRMYAAMEHPDAPAVKYLRESLLGFALADGRTIVTSFGECGEVSSKSTSFELGGLQYKVYEQKRFRYTARIPSFRVPSARLIRRGSARNVPKSRMASFQARGDELASLWNPESLEGCVPRSSRQFLSGRANPVVVLNLDRPITFRTFVRTYEKEWPPEDPVWAGRYRQITCSRIAVARYGDETHLGFYVPGERRWYVVRYPGVYKDGVMADRYRELYDEMLGLARR